LGQSQNTSLPPSSSACIYLSCQCVPIPDIIMHTYASHLGPCRPGDGWYM
jgi:hypothetical protein